MGHRKWFCRDITLPTKACLVKAMVFPVVIYGCEHWTIKKAECPRVDAFELWCWRRLLRVPWTAMEIQPVHSKGNQSWIFIGRIDAEEPILWPPYVKNWLIGKDPDAGKIEGGRRRDDRGWDGWMHHGLNEYEFEKTLGVSDGQGGLACYSPWGRKESDLIEWLNWNELRQRRSHIELSAMGRVFILFKVHIRKSFEYYIV